MVPDVSTMKGGGFIYETLGIGNLVSLTSTKSLELAALNCGVGVVTTMPVWVVGG